MREPLVIADVQRIVLADGFRTGHPLGDDLRLRVLLWEKAFGPDCPNVAPTLEVLARLYRASRREKEAEELEIRAARIRSLKR